MSDSSLQRLQTELRETPLRERMRNSCGRIGEMCADGRPPKMSIPVRSVDDDFYIATTIRDAEDEIDRLTAEIEAIRKDAQAYPYIFWAAYHRGHNDTVDGDYIDVAQSDCNSYWRDEAIIASREYKNEFGSEASK
jgi:hypothetical protein